MSTVEDMIQAFVAWTNGAITKEEYHVHHKEFCERIKKNHCQSCEGKNLAALFEDARFREAVLKHKGEENGRILINSGLNCGKHNYSECVCGKEANDAVDNSGEH